MDKLTKYEIAFMLEVRKYGLHHEIESIGGLDDEQDTDELTKVAKVWNHLVEFLAGIRQADEDDL